MGVDVGAKSIQLQPGAFMKKNKADKMLVPSFLSARNHSVQMKKVLSERKLPTLGPSMTKQTFLSKHNTIVPNLKPSGSKMSFGDPTLNRVYSNPQFQSLNQAPYMRPKTTAFGYPGGNILK